MIQVSFIVNTKKLQIEFGLVLPPVESESGNVRSERQRSRLDKRKRAKGGLMSTREELFAGEFDGYDYPKHCITFSK